jgi:hypothetical protein
LSDRKRVNIKSIWTRLRSLKRGALTQLKCDFISRKWYNLSFGFFAPSGRVKAPAVKTP